MRSPIPSQVSRLYGQLLSESGQILLELRFPAQPDVGRNLRQLSQLGSDLLGDGGDSRQWITDNHGVLHFSLAVFTGLLRSVR